MSIRCPNCDQELPAATIAGVISAEFRRRRAKQQRTGAGPGRPRKVITCPKCGVQGSAAEMQRHRCG